MQGRIVNELILSKNGHKQLAQKRETDFWGVMDHTLLQRYRTYYSKNYFRSWILAEVEQLLAKLYLGWDQR